MGDPFVQSHVKELNDTIGVLRQDKIELAAQAKKHEATIAHLHGLLNQAQDQSRQKQVSVDQTQYELCTLTRRSSEECTALKHRVSELELLLTQVRREADEYYKNGLERNLEATTLGNQVLLYFPSLNLSSHRRENLHRLFIHKTHSSLNYRMKYRDYATSSTTVSIHAHRLLHVYTLTVCYTVSIHVTVCYTVSIHVTVCYTVSIHVTVCYTVSIHVTVCYTVSIHAHRLLHGQYTHSPSVTRSVYTSPSVTRSAYTLTVCYTVSIHVTVCYTVSIHVTVCYTVSIHVTVCYTVSIHVTVCYTVSIHTHRLLHVYTLTVCYTVSIHVTVCYTVSIHVTVCYTVSIHVTVCYTVSIHVTVCYTVSIHVTVCYTVSIHAHRLLHGHSNISRPPSDPSVTRLQSKLKTAAQRITQLVREKDQLIQMGNKLRAELSRQKGDSSTRDTVPPSHLERTTPSLVKVTPNEMTNQLQTKLSAMEKLQYALTTHELQVAQRMTEQQKIAAGQVRVNVQSSSSESSPSDFNDVIAPEKGKENVCNSHIALHV
ncbi:hypothetical protein QZH41_011624 [Actinostola sp. cb2023]|nr:hypothetical protein QZH41_011624 [Actinostola sp. cb2023]